ncbi:uncharacterized protein LOC133531276 [Cydia pomonella]|uniref:uncharacterized protein LOC133531276 n=1 Tax=Cydia pomonella TaxID=82600 RepID=UPI002ADDC0D0|nr:uncharacterized protein LOC133531276 [Cydia pomonella]
MLTAVKVAFGFCTFFLAFEETVSWTIDLPQVRKYFFEKNMQERERQDRWKMQEAQRLQQVVYDNIHTKSLHFDYEKYKKHYADDYKYNGYMEHKVHEAVQNGSVYLDGLRRSIEAYLQRLESCRGQNMTVNVVQLRRYSNQNQSNAALYYFLTNPANPLTNPTKPSLIQEAILNSLLPFSTYGLPIPTNLTTVTQMNMNFTSFLAMAPNYTMFNMSEEFRNCVRADLASEHVRRLAELAVWAASELQDKLYADKYSEHKHDAHENDHGHENGILGSEHNYGHGHENTHYNTHDNDHGHDDDSLVLRLAWFLDRLAHLTGYDPTGQDFEEQSTGTSCCYLYLHHKTFVPFPENTMAKNYSLHLSVRFPSTINNLSPPARPLTSSPMIPTLISNADLQFLTTCLRGTNGTATERCAFPSGSTPPNLESLQAMGMQLPVVKKMQDLRPSASETEEYTYSEQVFTDDDMPLSLPQRPAKTKCKRSVQTDPLENFVQYFAKYKAWTGSNQEEKYSSETSHVDTEKDNSEMSHVNTNTENVVSNSNTIRRKRFVVKKKAKHIKPDPFPIASYVKHKLEVHVKKDEKEAKGLKKLLEKLHKPKTEVKLLKFKKSKRSIKYSRKEQPRVPDDPQMDISYYVKNKPGRNYNYNAAQAALLRAGLEQVFQTGNILVVQRFGSNYNPANREVILDGYVAGLLDE